MRRNSVISTITPNTPTVSAATGTANQKPIQSKRSTKA